MTAPAIRPDVAALLAAVPSDGPKIWELPPPAAREVYAGMMAMVDRPPAELAVVRDLVIAGPDGDDLPVRLFDAREERPPGPVLVFIHGGGFVMGSVDLDASFVSHMAAALDLPIVSVEYRLAPEAPFPAAPRDCEAAARWVAGNPVELGREATALVIAGESAGGMLTINTTIALRDAPAAVPVILQAAIVPIVDLAADEQRFPSLTYAGHTYTPEGRAWAHEQYAPDLADPRSVPLSVDQTGMPPTLVATTGHDILRDEGRAYAQALIAAGNPDVSYLEMPDQIHGYYLFCGAAPSSAADVDVLFARMRAMIAER